MNIFPNYKSVIGLMVVFIVSGCTTLDPYTREEKTSNATKGAAIGAASGAVLGLITGDDSAERKKHALILAGVGAVAGAGVGAYMDKQEAELREQLEGTGVSVTRVGDNINLNMPGNVTFAVNSADVSADFYEVLNSVAIVLDEFDSTLVEVAGYTDSTGSEEYNMSLSRKRASSVASYLSAQNVRPDRLMSVGGGESRPIASNDTPEGREQNRRVELTIVPITTEQVSAAE